MRHDKRIEALKLISELKSLGVSLILTDGFITFDPQKKLSADVLIRTAKLQHPLTEILKSSAQ